MAPVRRAYFERLYAASDAPWDFESSWYERRKYALTLAALPRPRYRSAFEPGCSFGELTELLAPRCDALLAYEMIPDVAERARSRFAGRSHVEIQTLAIPEAWPRRALDLVILSEVAYYLSESGLDDLASSLEKNLEPGGHPSAVRPGPRYALHRLGDPRAARAGKTHGRRRRPRVRCRHHQAQRLRRSDDAGPRHPGTHLRYAQLLPC